MLISINLFGKLLSTWHFPEKVNNKPFTLSGFAVNSRFSWKHVLFFGSRTPFVSSCDWLVFWQSVVLCFMPNICFMNTIMQMCQLTASQSACVTCANNKKNQNGGGGDKCSARALSPCAFRLAPCVARCSPQRERSGPFCMQAAASWLIWKMTVRLWMTTVPHWFVMKPLSRLTNEGEGNVQAYD